MTVSRGTEVISRILEVMDRQHISWIQLAVRLRMCTGNGWSDEYTALRLGQLLPLGPGRTSPGGRVPLRATEIDEMARALGVSPAELLGEQEPALAAAS